MHCLKCLQPIRNTYSAIEINTKQTEFKNIAEGDVPKPGCPTVCYYCATIGVFNEDLNIRQMTSLEWAILIASRPDVAEILKEAQQIFERNKPRSN